MRESYYDIESFKFEDIVILWGRERLVHEIIIARELAKGIVQDGLRIQSFNPNWVKSSEILRGYPLVGYSAHQDSSPILIRAEVLEHLLAITREAVEPDLQIFAQEFVTKNDFCNWLVHTGQSIPEFWFKRKVSS